MSGIYIHIPFCSRRCTYCDFYLITNLNLIDKFLLNLKKEITISSEFYKDYTFDTIFFGGGTPSVLSPHQIADIINCLHKNYSINNGAEVNMEANPEDFVEKKISDYSSAGINRLSLGIQSFRDSELKFLTRQHTAEEAERIVNEAVNIMDNVSVDIIYSLPSQSISELDYSLSRAAALGVKHISTYTLTYEERTVLYKSLQKNLFKKNTDNIEAELYSFVSEKLISNGFQHYEVSNFAKEGYKSRHNLKYWNYENYLGFGPSAHSFFNYTRWNNFRDIGKYNSTLEKNRLPIEDKYKVNRDQKHIEFIMLSLRSGGINFKKYFEIFNENFENKFQHSCTELIKNEYAELSNEKFILTEKGYAVADEIVAKYF